MLLMLVSALSITGCKEEIPAIKYRQQGFIKGTINGTAYDDKTPFTRSFTYTQYSPLLNFWNSTFRLKTDGSVYLQASRIDFVTAGNVQFSMQLKDVGAKAPLDQTFALAYYEEGNEIFFFDMQEFKNSISFTDFSFDADTGRLKFNYTLKGETNSTNNTAVVTGSVDIVLKKEVQ